MRSVELLARLAYWVAVAVAFILTPGHALAAYPEKPITLIVPWNTGGAADVTGRMIASLLQKELGQPIEVVNRTGGSGVVGLSAIAKAAPDGYTIGVVTVEIGMMHWAGLTELKGTDFTPIALYSYDPAALQVRADAPWKTAKDLLDAVKANSGKYKASGTGTGGIWHLAFAGMLAKAGLDPNAAPWTPSQGPAPGLQDLAAGKVDIVTCSLGEAAALIGAGKVRSLAVMDAQKLDAFPDIPPLKDAAGVDWQMSAWRGIAAPKGLPEDVAARLVAAIEKVTQSQDFIAFMKGHGFGTIWRARADFAKWMADNDATLGATMKAVGNGK
jgi:tripartite-type tricarboxylate transporter receptor subunit TctC